jgi:hypothetical protein
MQSTAVRSQENQAISTTYRRRTFSGQSGGLENVGPRETKFGLMANPTVRSFSQRSPQIQGIFDVRVSGREICRRAKWRRERVWNPTFSARKSLILLGWNLSTFRIPCGHPNGSKSIITHLKVILLFPGPLHCFDGQVNNGLQTPFVQVAELYRPAMGLNDGSGNCQTQTGTARIAAA